MKIDVIDCRGFVKTPPYINSSMADKPLNNAKMVRPGFNGQGKNSQKRSLGVQPLTSMKGVK